MAKFLLKYLKKSQNTFEWLDCFPMKHKNGDRALSNYLRWNKLCYFELGHVHVSEKPETNFINSLCDQTFVSGLFLAIARDKCGGHMHTIGINIDQTLIFDCNETKILPFTVNDLSICCGPGVEFDRFDKVVQLFSNRKDP